MKFGVPKDIRTADAGARLAFLLDKIGKAEAIPSFAYLEGWENIPHKFIEKVCGEIADAEAKMVSEMVKRTNTMPKWRFLNDIRNSFACAPEEVRTAAIGRFSDLAVEVIWSLDQSPEANRIAEKLGINISDYKSMSGKPGAKEAIDEAVEAKKNEIRKEKGALGAYLNASIDLSELKKGSVRGKMRRRFSGDGGGFKKKPKTKHVAA
ncbi:hypothetical protein COV61_04000 [Candidatus Micrarchaeota archaeon CG11_big_fil_rev_8_21_14_0_20_47_5]|nr:MAG: hypothetical protein AUJ17_01775 [Candidatus Micrarchaeota archaeon CG1_02_47_40]PIN83119.1 MAG: hypothetical protein COV61_04000 [Candidatus Micrarchaeota archaeon CG11_big_fil_rev_8_21_14_0_20_47_5]